MLNLFYSLIWIAGMTFAPFAFFESIISEDMKKRLSDALISNPNAVESLPWMAGRLFERVFGKSHFSLRCILASVAASLFFLLLAYLLRLLLIIALHASQGDNAHDYFLGELAYPFAGEVRISFAISVAANLILDYFGLLKTRLIIRFLTRRSFSILVCVPLVIADIAISFLIFQCLYILFYFVGMIHLFSPFHLFPAADPYSIGPMFEVLIILRLATFPGYPSGTALNFFLHSHFISIVLAQMLVPLFLTSVFFYASVAPSIWLWLFVFAGTVSRLVAPSWPSALYVLDFERAPLKMVGLFASALVVLLLTFVLCLLAIIISTLSVIYS